jgi:hypothetical protein
VDDAVQDALAVLLDQLRQVGSVRDRVTAGAGEARHLGQVVGHSLGGVIRAPLAEPQPRLGHLPARQPAVGASEEDRKELVDLTRGRRRVDVPPFADQGLLRPQPEDRALVLRVDDDEAVPAPEVPDHRHPVLEVTDQHDGGVARGEVAAEPGGEGPALAALLDQQKVRDHPIGAGRPPQALLVDPVGEDPHRPPGRLRQLPLGCRRAENEEAGGQAAGAAVGGQLQLAHGCEELPVAHDVVSPTLPGRPGGLAV